MRHIGDTLVWLGLVLVAAAVIYFTPRVSDYVASLGIDRGQEPASHGAVALHDNLGGSHVNR